MTPSGLRRQALFRQEAVDFQLQQRLSGGVVLLQPLPTRILAWFLVAATASFLAFAAIGQYARKETVRGYLSPTAGVARVVAPRAGTVAAVHVEEGQKVGEGQPLLTVAIDQTAMGGRNVDAEVIEALGRQRALLMEQIATQEARLPAERRRLEERIAGIGGEIAQLETQLEVQRRRARIALELATSVEGLRTKGYMAEAELKRRRDGHLEQEQSAAAVGVELAERRTDLAEATAELEQLPSVMAERTQALRGQLAEVELRLAEADGRRAYVLRAPIAGRVATLQAAVGRAVEPGHLQLSILPADSMLRAELFVPTAAIGFVRPGQTVRILYDAFPYQRFGTYGGRVASVSQTILNDADVATGPVRLDGPAYKVTVTLDRQDVTAYGERMPLQADMLLRADIILDRRSLLAWLLDPLLSARVS